MPATTCCFIRSAENSPPLKDLLPDIAVISLDRLPSHGRAVAKWLWETKRRQHIPIIFAGGEPLNVDATRLKFPKTVYCSTASILGVAAKLTRTRSSSDGGAVPTLPCVPGADGLGSARKALQPPSGARPAEGQVADEATRGWRLRAKRSPGAVMNVHVSIDLTTPAEERHHAQMRWAATILTNAEISVRVFQPPDNPRRLIASFRVPTTRQADIVDRIGKEFRSWIENYAHSSIRFSHPARKPRRTSRSRQRRPTKSP